MKMTMAVVPKTARRLEKKVRRKSRRRLRVWTPPGAATASCPTDASATLVPHPWVEDRVEDIDEEVHQHEKRRPVEDYALDHGVVAADYRLVGDLPDPRPGEDRLRDDRPAHQEAYLEPDNRDGRQHGVPQGVLEDHQPRDDPLGAGRADVVLPHHLQHAGAGHPRDDRHRYGPQGEGWHDQVQQPVPEPREVEREERVDQHQPGYGGDGVAAAQPSRERQEPQLHGEDHDQDHRQPEDRHAYPREREDGRDLVEDGVLLDRRDHADRHPHQDRDEHGEGRELERGREAHEELRRHRTPRYDGGAKVPLDRVLEEEPVLDDDGFVQPHALPQLLYPLLGRQLAEEYLGRIAGDGPHHEEDHDGHPDQDRDDLQYPASDVLRQSPNLLRSEERRVGKE